MGHFTYYFVSIILIYELLIFLISIPLFLYPNILFYLLFFYSKSYCPYCSRVKDLFSKLGVTYKVVELDVESEYTILLSNIFKVR